MKDWKSTLIGAGFAVTTAVTATVNYEMLSSRQLIILGAFALAQFLFGLWVKDRA